MAKNKGIDWIGVFFAVSLGFFVWLSWKRLATWIGDETLTWFIAGSIVVLGLVLGYLNKEKIAERFA